MEREQLRCREDIRIDLQRARHRLGNFLLRREIYWEALGGVDAPCRRLRPPNCWRRWRSRSSGDGGLYPALRAAALSPAEALRAF